MAINWPTLPNIIMKGFSLLLFVGTAVMKVQSIKTIYSVLGSICIVGWEFASQENVFLALSLSTLIPDLVYIIVIVIALAVNSSNFGADPMAIAYNFFATFSSFAAMSTMSTVGGCESETMPIIRSSSFFAMISGILHIINCLFCFMFMNPEER